MRDRLLLIQMIGSRTAVQDSNVFFDSVISWPFVSLFFFEEIYSLSIMIWTRVAGHKCGVWTHLFPRYEMSIRLKLKPSQGNDMLRIQESCGIFALRQKDSDRDLCVCCVSGELHHVLNMNQRQHPRLCFHNKLCQKRIQRKSAAISLVRL